MVKTKVTKDITIKEIEVGNYSYIYIVESGNKAIHFMDDGDLIVTRDNIEEGFDEYIVNLEKDFEWLWNIIRNRVITEKELTDALDEGEVIRLYRCPACGDTITEEEYLTGLDIGSMGYCYCEYGMNEDGYYNRTLNEYEVFVKEE
jgi:hypothetical protein